MQGEIIPCDVAMILTMHSEGRMLLPTAYALGNAVRDARAAGLTVEVIAVFDRADEQTRRAWQSLRHDADLGLATQPTVMETDHGDLGLARMAGIAASTARYVGVLDADNLPTRNWIADAVRALEVRQDPAIAHPALIHTFDAEREIWPLNSSESASFRLGTLAWFNPWDAFAIAHREVFERFPYRRLPPHEGFGPEDWTWNCDTLAGGLPHLVVPGTALFYQKKHHGLATAHGNSLLPRNALLTSKTVALAEIDALNRTLDARAAAQVDTAPALARRIRHARPVDLTVRGIRYATRPLRDRAARRAPQPPHEPHPHLRDPRLRAHWAEAHRLQPRIPHPSDDVARDYGLWGDDWNDLYVPDRLAYWSAIAALPESPDIVFFAPWIGTGGADLLATQYINTVRQLRPDASVVLITTEPRPSTRLDLLDPGVTVFDLGAFRLNQPFAVRVIGMLLTQLRPEVVHVINSTAAYDAVDRYGVAIVAHTRIFLSTYVVDTFADGTEWSFAFHRSRDFFERVTALLTDNTKLARRLIVAEGVPEHKILVHHQIVDERFEPRSPASFGMDRPVRLVWIGRFDRQKRLDRLVPVVEALTDGGTPFQIDVYGEPVIDDDPSTADTVQKLRALGVAVRPPFLGGFSSIGPGSADALLITSQDEGTPNTMLEAMSSGVPVIAAAVGDIPRLIDDRTGYLVTDPDSTAEYVDAVQRLVTDQPAAIAKAAAARQLVEAEYSRAELERTLTDLVGYLPAESGTTRGLHLWRWHAAPDTQRLLAGDAPTVLIYTGSNGHSNFGDILQTKNIVRYWRDRGEATPVLFLPAFAARPAGRDQDLMRWLGAEHVVFFGPETDEDLGERLPPLPPRNTSSLLHVVGGGYLNEMWGAQHLAAITAIAESFSVRGIVMSGLQLDASAIPPLEAVASRHPVLALGVRDHASLQLVKASTLPAVDTFDDLIEVLDEWAADRPAPDPQRIGPVVIHMNTSDYAGGEKARAVWLRLLRQIASHPASGSSHGPESGQLPEVIVLSAYADHRPDVHDALRTIADLAEDFPFTAFRVIDIAKVALSADLGQGLPPELAILSSARFAVTSSYHTALMMTALGVPSYLVGANGYFAQKAGLFRLASFEDFLADPRAQLLDLTLGREARRKWIATLNEIR